MCLYTMTLYNYISKTLFCVINQTTKNKICVLKQITEYIKTNMQLLSESELVYI